MAPPEKLSASPVIIEESSDARKTQALATSSGLANLPSADASRNPCSTSSGVVFRASARSYEPDNAGVDVDGLAVSIGVDRKLTETTRFRAEVGVEETEPAGGESDSNVVWDINLVKNLETVRLLAQYRGSMNAGGAGRVTARNEFNLSVKKVFFPERLEGGLGVRAYTTDQLSSDPGTVDERDYAQFRAQLTYAMTRIFSVQADYRYTYIDRSTTAGSDNSNSIVLWLIYQPTAMTTSR